MKHSVTRGIVFSRIPRKVRLITVTAAFGILAILLGINVAHALWSESAANVMPTFNIGSVSFGVTGYSDDTGQSVSMSQQGEAVELRVPGSVISQVRQQRGATAVPVIYRFEVVGWAHGIAGIDYTIDSVHQVSDEQRVTLFHDGRIVNSAIESTFLHHSTMAIYTASVGGDCIIPDSLNTHTEFLDSTSQQLLVANNDIHTTLQIPGMQAAPPQHISKNIWCVELNFNHENDGWYANDAFVIGQAEDSRLLANIAQWHSHISFPPSLPSLGEYVGIVNAWARAADETEPETWAQWRATVFPDPGAEPDVVITIQPYVTSVRTDVNHILNE